MPSTSGERVLHVLLIRNRATTAQLAEALAVSADEISPVLRDAEARGLVRDSGNPRIGWAITPEGTREARRRVDDTPAEGRALVSARYEEFRELNDELKQLCADWQLRDPATMGPGDFTARLQGVDERIQRLLAEIQVPAPHFADYGPRLARARARFESGSDGYLTGVLVDSYHNIWFECHECFHITLGRSRREEESGT
ncbi:DNA-binding MarR family transcriptional regulator [Amycolatopsis bartoniae]|uniref:Uncharacterized protein n=1 Tax=Amycolatopsis bartoniae TaxID=941986 RepID=A0A8H9IUA3_9PSEU|nr:hypothetical protein [Amycolatopsis bartoniae]MBB2934904.1 DNA-binding MarR family transcriptional regulator [Amycolatopsis bartoniae]TVS99509.1 hypothetical protein FNH07_34585 [Amycolatopsis bartoniae]GHF43944.1 hypothetical protein GCM10017566_16000 [Amycolatopsis bartoniae]